LKREKDKEELAVYRTGLKSVIRKILLNNPKISIVTYEEPFIGQIYATKSLFVFRTLIEEIKAEESPCLDYIKYLEVHNKKWKKLFLRPDVCSNSSKIEKMKIKNKLFNLYEYCKGITQDEVDACAIALVVVKNKNFLDDLSNQKKRFSRFKFNAEFIVCDSYDDVVDYIPDLGIPEEVVENGVVLYNLNGKEDFEEAIYKNMGNDDKLIILKFNSKKRGDIVLKYKLGNIVNYGDNIYALAWRQNRKRG